MQHTSLKRDARTVYRHAVRARERLLRANSDSLEPSALMSFQAHLNIFDRIIAEYRGAKSGNQLIAFLWLVQQASAPLTSERTGATH